MSTPRNQRRIRLIDRDGSSDAARYERARRRSMLVVGLIATWLVVCIFASLHSVLHVEEVQKFADVNITHRSKIKTRRGTIFDRNMVTLSTDVRADSVVVDPRWVKPPGRRGQKLPLDHPDVLAVRQKVARIVARVTGKSFHKIHKRLGWKRGFVYLAKNIDAKASRTLLRYIGRGDLPAVRIEPGFRRYNPNGDLAGVLLGRHTWTGSVERSYDKLLRGQMVEIVAYKDRHADRLYFDGAPDPRKYGGQSLVLTIDEKIQAVTAEKLREGVRAASANHGFAIVMDVRNAEVLALSTWPRADPNDRTKPSWKWRNPIVQDLFEPGSTMKVMTLAAALEEGKVKLHSQFRTKGGIWFADKHIKKHRDCADVVTAAAAIECSSNVAVARIAQRIGKQKLYDYLKRLGFGRRTDSGLVGEIGGLLSTPRRWSNLKLANVAFGQGVATTALQVCAAMTAIGSGGIWRRPKFLRGKIGADGKETWYPAEKGKRVLSTKTASDLIIAMERVVRGENGTASKARLANYRVAGKTGTAQQVEPGKGYSKTHWVASFAGLMPVDKPRIAVFVAVDTPRKKHPKYPSVIIRTGGAIAAPIVAEIGRFTLPYLGIPHSKGAPYLAADNPDKARKLAKLRATRARIDAEKQAAKAAAEAAKRSESVGEKDAAAVAVAKKPEVQSKAPTGSARVPDLRGLPLTRARLKLASLNLAMEPTGSGVVVKQTPRPGVLLADGGTVQVRLRRFTELAAAARTDGGRR